jgi:hypothetical protein
VTSFFIAAQFWKFTWTNKEYIFCTFNLMPQKKGGVKLVLPLHCINFSKCGGRLPPAPSSMKWNFWTAECSGKTNFTPPFFWGIKFKKKNLFL